MLDDATIISDSPYLVASFGLHPKIYNYPFIHRLIANHIPILENENDCDNCDYGDCAERSTMEIGQPMLFQCISNKSSGRKMLGYLKADVDNLGGIFAFGLKNNASVSRISTLSRMLDEFFAGYMPLLMKQSFPDLYTVFSGGDDVLVIGPWDQLLSFSEKLNAEFKYYTCDNDNITLSAGISFVKHGHPVYRSVESAESELKKAKGMEGKNRITLFSETIPWKALSEMIAEGKRISSWVQQKSISVGFLRNLLYYYTLYKDYREKGHSESLRYLPLLTYDIARNLSPPDSYNQEKREIRLWAEGLKEPDSVALNNLGITINYALNAIRGGKDG